MKLDPTVNVQHQVPMGQKDMLASVAKGLRRLAKKIESGEVGFEEMNVESDAHYTTFTVKVLRRK